MLRVLSPAILFTGFVAVCVVLVMVPVGSWSGSGCVVWKQTGVYCPGCGGTRAACHLVRGNWREAAQSNLLIYPVAAGILWGVVAFGANRWAGTRWRSPLGVTTRMMLVLLLVVTVFTVVRNLGWAWFLRP